MGEFFKSICDFIRQLWPLHIVEPDEGGVKVRFGKVVRACEPGLYFIVPFFEHMATMEITEQVIDLRPQSVTTNDGRAIAISGAISYRVKNPEKAMYHVQDVDVSLPTLSLGVIAHYVNQHSFAECLVVEHIVKEILVKIKSEAQRKWGLEILNIWVTDCAEHKVYRIIGTSESSMAFFGDNEV